MIEHSLYWLAAISLASSALNCRAQDAASRPDSGKAEGMVMLDYETLSVPGSESIDLMGFHVLNRMNDWLYLGVGGYAPLFKGQYGGFMALDATAHVQRRVFGRWFANAGLSVGGGGGGKSRQQSTVLSGTGGFGKAYLGMGYGFDDFSVGVNIARMKFEKSVIDSSQVNVYLQLPFSYATGPYASAGTQAAALDRPANRSSPADPGENMLTLGADNYLQIRPKGLSKATINVADLQFTHFMTGNSYWYFNAAVGYHGLALYNQVLGGLGYRWPVSPRTSLYGQLGIGSGGYSPENVDTGAGLLVYPKVSAEYRITDNLGVALSAGYLFAPNASSKNYTVGASLNYHIRSLDAAGAGTESVYKGYRISVFPQTEFNVKSRGVEGDNLKLLSAQFDSVVSDHVYIPLQVSIAYNAYLGYPGYGELLAGVGLQTRHAEGDRFQWFGQLMLGTNSQGAIFKTGIGFNLGLSDRLAVHAMAGQTVSATRNRYRSDQLGVGLTYRFSVPTR